MGRIKKEMEEFYQPQKSRHTLECLEDSCQKQIQLLYELDELIGKMGYQLNRAQKLLSLRISLPFYKSYKVNGYGYDFKPVWVRQIEENGKWYSIRLDDRNPPRKILALKSSQPIIGNNKRVIIRLVKELEKLLALRAELVSALSEFRSQNATRCQRINAVINRKTEFLISLENRIIPLNIALNENSSDKCNLIFGE